ncbi:MAG: hypothetical protein HGB21_13080 [Nitrospirae bacterium]|nr:hypothetical protein [Nitrospirota bacterium]
MKKQKVTKILECQLTDAERIGHGTDMSTLTLEINELEEQKKSVMADYKARIDGKGADARRIAQILKQGYELREVDCEELRDYETRTVTVVRLDTGEMVSSRGMTIEEMQEAMGFAQDAEYEEVDRDQPAPDTGKIIRLVEHD